MKKSKKLYIAAIAALSLGCFFSGRATANYEEVIKTTETTKPQVEENPLERNFTLNLSYNEDFSLACDFMGQIVDWNTDGNELSIMTADGYELYAYKSQDVYNTNRMFVPVKGECVNERGVD